MTARTTKAKVEQFLKDNPRLRDSDTWLLFAYWQAEGLVLSYEQKQKLADITIAESITRARRNLRKKYPGSKQVEEERYNKSEQYRIEYGNDPL